MLRGNGHVDLGDFGLAVRPRTGNFTPFVYADAGGRKSNSVGECSRKMIRNLFGGAAAEEDICYIVFPGSASGNVVNPALISPRVQQMLGDLAKFDNALDVITNLLWPNLAETMAAAQSAQGGMGTDPILQAPQIPNYVRPPARSDLAKTAGFQSVLGAMRRAGFSATS